MLVSINLFALTSLSSLEEQNRSNTRKSYLTKAIAAEMEGLECC
jgi:hypothetical protein